MRGEVFRDVREEWSKEGNDSHRRSMRWKTTHIFVAGGILPYKVFSRVCVVYDVGGLMHVGFREDDASPG